MRFGKKMYMQRRDINDAVQGDGWKLE